MISVRVLQKKLNLWLNYNFPNATADDQFKGIVEEIGELAHAELKTKQCIRGYTEEKGMFEIKDAIGDIFIYLCNYCNKKDIDMEECIDIAYDTIMKRDWQKNPDNGEE